MRKTGTLFSNYAPFQTAPNQTAPTHIAPLRIFTILVILLSTVTAVAQEDFTPNLKPSLSVPRLQGQIAIDGVIDDSGWKTAAQAGNFCEVEPGDNLRPDVTTEVKVTYDEHNLYMLFVAYDDPADIRATMSDRDNIWRDDYVGMILDTYGDRAWAYELFVNPFGVQADLRWFSNGEDMSLDIVWYSAGQITDSGWQVEVAIPFQSLRFPNQPEQAWSATFWRNRPRSSRFKYSWAAMDRDDPCWPCAFGTLTGIRDVKPGGKLEVLPSVIAYQSGSVVDDTDADAGFHNESIDGDVSIGAKYTLASDCIAEGTINPDFSQIESDGARIDVNTTTALYYPERRPFFQEGADLFDTWITVVYTRMINDPTVAGKLYGRFNRTSLAFIGAYDENTPVLMAGEDRSYSTYVDQSFVSIARVKQTLMDDSYVGFTLTDRRYRHDGSGTLFSLDSKIRLYRNLSLRFQGASTYTKEPEEGYIKEDDEGAPVTFDDGNHTFSFDGESFWGHTIYSYLYYASRSLDWGLDFYEFSPTYRPNTGYRTRAGYRRGAAWVGGDYRPNNHPVIDHVNFTLSSGRLWNWDGQFKDEWLKPALWMRLKAQTTVTSSLRLRRELFRDSVISGIREFEFSVDSRFSKPLSAGFWFQIGNSLIRFVEAPVLGKAREFEFWSRLQVTRNFTIQPWVNLFRARFMDDVETAYFTDPVIRPGQDIVETWIVGSRFDFQLTRYLNARLIVEYFDEDNFYIPDDSRRSLSLEPLITYEINPYTVFYLGSTHDYKDYNYAGIDCIRRHSQQFFAKLQYLFRP